MADSRVVVIVQARTGSARLPGKSMRALAGRPMILHVMERASEIGYFTIMATSSEPRDDLLSETVTQAGHHVWRGSEHDVLCRMAEAAKITRADAVVRVTGDCPLLAPDLARTLIELFFKYGADRYVSNDTSRSGWPDGLDVEVFPAEALFLAHEKVPPLSRETTNDREHVTPWIRRSLPSLILESSEDWRLVKLSVDELHDFERVANVFGRLPNQDHTWKSTRASLASLGYLPVEKKGGKA